jgi:hypothetical protein
MGSERTAGPYGILKDDWGLTSRYNSSGRESDNDDGVEADKQIFWLDSYGIANTE